MTSEVPQKGTSKGTSLFTRYLRYLTCEVPHLSMSQIANIASYKEKYFYQENSRPTNKSNKCTKFQPNPMIFKDIEPIVFWVTTPTLKFKKVRPARAHARVMALRGRTIEQLY